MGCVMSAEEKAQQQISRRIDDDLASEMAHRKNEIKLLLLGKEWGVLPNGRWAAQSGWA